tara:strand:+ start:674 stop:1342 length:669 start_codon:yes stop_codon:yes gene_type:complete
MDRCELPRAQCDDATGFSTAIAEACERIPSEECSAAISSAAATYGMGCIGTTPLAVVACSTAGNTNGGLCGYNLLAEIPGCTDPDAPLSECEAQLQLAVGKYGGDLVATILANRDCLGIGTDVCTQLHRRTCTVMPSTCEVAAPDLLGATQAGPGVQATLRTTSGTKIAVASAIAGFGLGLGVATRHTHGAAVPAPAPAEVVYAYDASAPVDSRVLEPVHVY